MRFNTLHSSQSFFKEQVTKTSLYITAKKIVATLTQHGFTAFFAGGWVRDLVMQNACEDIDIATSATPEQVMSLFRTTIPVGAAFGVVIVVQHGFQFEVASFRNDGAYINGRTPQSISWSSPEEDAVRRDFTINGLFYDPLQECIIDFVDGRQDIEQQIIRAIGNPIERFTEDRLRMIRAIRFSHRLGFKIEEKTWQAILSLAPSLLPSVSMERIWQEMQKMANNGSFAKALYMMSISGLLQAIFPNYRHEETILHKLDSFSERTPPIFYLVHLFLDATYEQSSTIWRHLKASQKEKKQIKTLYQARNLILQEKEQPISAWVEFYAQEYAKESLEVTYWYYFSECAVAKIRAHEEIIENYQEHISRVQQRHPVVKAEDLIEQGVKPGKMLGALLNKAQVLSIELNTFDKELILRYLANEIEVYPQ